jgi:hypothetical protein
MKTTDKVLHVILGMVFAALIVALIFQALAK